MTVSALEAGARHERRVARRLEARGSPGLAEALCRLRGIVLGDRWRIDTLYAAGAEGAVYLLSDVRDASAPRCVAKVPLLPYHRPAEISASSVRKRREALREEAQHLEGSASPHMPRSQGLHEFKNPLLDPARGGTFQETDRALVMEWIAGLDVDLWLARVHHSKIPRDLLRHHLDRIAVVLLEALYDLQERGFLYADLRPGNLRMVGGPGRRVRLLDAGSLVLAEDRSGKFPHVPHYLPPALFEQRYGRGVDILPTPAVQAVMAGRTLYEVATGIVPIPGQPLRTEAYKDCAVSPLVADIVDGLATGSFQNVVYAMRYLQKQSKRAPRAAPAGARPATTPAAAPAATPAPAPAPAPAPMTAAAPAASNATAPAAAPAALNAAASAPARTVVNASTPAPKPAAAAPAAATAHPAPAKPVSPAPKPAIAAAAKVPAVTSPAAAAAKPAAVARPAPVAKPATPATPAPATRPAPAAIPATRPAPAAVPAATPAAARAPASPATHRTAPVQAAAAKPAASPVAAPAVPVPAAAALPAATKTPAAPRVLQPLEFAPDPEEPVRRPPAAPVSRVPERRTPQPVAPRTAPANREEEAHYAARPPSARRLLGTQGHRRGGWLRRMLRWAFGRS